MLAATYPVYGSSYAQLGRISGLGFGAGMLLDTISPTSGWITNPTAATPTAELDKNKSDMAWTGLVSDILKAGTAVGTSFVDGWVKAQIASGASAEKANQKAAEAIQYSLKVEQGQAPAPSVIDRAWPILFGMLALVAFGALRGR